MYITQIQKVSSIFCLPSRGLLIDQNLPKEEALDANVIKTSVRNLERFKLLRDLKVYMITTYKTPNGLHRIRFGEQSPVYEYYKKLCLTAPWKAETNTLL